jgi:V/A-type H+-transporting ATPase subunit I
MRYDVKKFLFVGVSKERSRFFEIAQELGVVHFLETKSKVKEVPGDVQDNMAAIKILRGLPPTEQEEIEDYAIADGLIQKILDLKHKKEKLSEEERIVRLDISRIEVFGDFSRDDIAWLEKETGRKVQFYFTKHGDEEKHPVPEDLIYVGSEHGLDYYVAFNKSLKQFPRMVEMQIPHPLGEQRQKLKEILAEYHAAENRLKGYAKYNTFLHHALIHKLNSYNLHAAQESVKWEMDKALFAIEGWVPVNKVKELWPLLEKLDVHGEEVAFDPNDVPPTVLENEGAARLGEDLVRIYDTPSYTDKDPSLWVLGFFALFFAFIVGDGGYGLIFLGVALYIRYKYTLNKTGTRVINLIMILGFACLCWGFLTTSFFGIHIGLDSPLRKVSLLQWLVEKKADYLIAHRDAEWQEWVKKIPALGQATNAKEFLEKGVVQHHGHPEHEILNKFSDNIMFELAILIGVIHLIISMLRYAKRTWTAFGWVLFLIGAYLYFPVFLGVNSIIHFVLGVNREAGAQAGLYLMFGGMALATILALIKHRFLGILEPMAVIQVFADTMSYLRLYALGLSGAMLTATMLDLAGSVNFILGALILIAGHLVNIVLSIMGGTIHGLRLNFLEWYHYSFEGGGRPFNPLRKLKIE